MKMNVTRALYALLIFGGLLGGRKFCEFKRKEQGMTRKPDVHMPYGFYEAAIKRPLDMILAGTALIF